MEDEERLSQTSFERGLDKKKGRSIIYLGRKNEYSILFIEETQEPIHVLEKRKEFVLNTLKEKGVKL
ncbi:MAG: hypothetical protein N2314_08375 [Brevinematales bacterium]|nr:hypothetical protein [Brevinematales bacterium]